VPLFGFTMGIYCDARTCERQNSEMFITQTVVPREIREVARINKIIRQTTYA
jgi:hypothetical protein